MLSFSQQNLTVATLIIRDLDDTLGRMLKREAAKRQLSVNRLMHQIIAQSLQKPASADPHAPRNDLARFAGKWKAADLRAFKTATQSFSEVEPELWK